MSRHCIAFLLLGGFEDDVKKRYKDIKFQPVRDLIDAETDAARAPDAGTALDTAVESLQWMN